MLTAVKPGARRFDVGRTVTRPASAPDGVRKWRATSPWCSCRPDDDQRHADGQHARIGRARLAGLIFRSSRPQARRPATRRQPFQRSRRYGRCERCAQLVNPEPAYVRARKLLNTMLSYACVYRYWKDVGTVDSFWEANMDLLKEKPEIQIYDQIWKYIQ